MCCCSNTSGIKFIAKASHHRQFMARSVLQHRFVPGCLQLLLCRLHRCHTPPLAPSSLGCDPEPSHTSAH